MNFFAVSVGSLGIADFTGVRKRVYFNGFNNLDVVGVDVGFRDFTAHINVSLDPASDSLFEIGFGFFDSVALGKATRQ